MAHDVFGEALRPAGAARRAERVTDDLRSGEVAARGAGAGHAGGSGAGRLPPRTGPRGERRVATAAGTRPLRCWSNQGTITGAPVSTGPVLASGHEAPPPERVTEDGLDVGEAVVMVMVLTHRSGWVVQAGTPSTGAASSMPGFCGRPRGGRRGARRGGRPQPTDAGRTPFAGGGGGILAAGAAAGAGLRPLPAAHRPRHPTAPSQACRPFGAAVGVVGQTWAADSAGLGRRFDLRLGTGTPGGLGHRRGGWFGVSSSGESSGLWSSHPWNHRRRVLTHRLPSTPRVTRLMAAPRYGLRLRPVARSVGVRPAGRPLRPAWPLR